MPHKEKHEEKATPRPKQMGTSTNIAAAIALVRKIKNKNADPSNSAPSVPTKNKQQKDRRR